MTARGCVLSTLWSQFPRTFRRRRPAYVEDSGRRPIAHKTAVRGGYGSYKGMYVGLCGLQGLRGLGGVGCRDRD